MDRYGEAQIRTRDWTMGSYPMPARQALRSLDDALAELREFHHDEAADVVEAFRRDLRGVVAALDEAAYVSQSKVYELEVDKSDDRDEAAYEREVGRMYALYEARDLLSPLAGDE